MSERTVLVDVREDIRNGREPFSKIMNSAAGLQAGEKLRLLAPFEPVPLVQVLAKHGFQHTASTNGAGDWEVIFERGPGGPAEQAMPPAPGSSESASGAHIGSSAPEIDARGLEPPQPLIKILEGVTTLPRGATLRARTDRRPIHLYAQLEERGCEATTEEQPDGSFLTHIRRS